MNARAEEHVSQYSRPSMLKITDLRVATAFVLPLGGQGRDEALAALRRNSKELRRAVSKELTLKFSPELRFALDETFDQMDETNRLLRQDTVRRDVEGD